MFSLALVLARIFLPKTFALVFYWSVSRSIGSLLLAFCLFPLSLSIYLSFLCVFASLCLAPYPVAPSSFRRSVPALLARPPSAFFGLFFFSLFISRALIHPAWRRWLGSLTFVNMANILKWRVEAAVDGQELAASLRRALDVKPKAASATLNVDCQHILVLAQLLRHATGQQADTDATPQPNNTAKTER